ncbi:MAG: hypothetical protein ACREDR_24180 [Blastocatellia bacterium]
MGLMRSSGSASEAPKPTNTVVRRCDFMGLASIIGFIPASSLFSDRPANPVIRNSLQARKVCVRMVCTPDSLYAEVVDAPAVGGTGPLSDLFE